MCAVYQLAYFVCLMWVHLTLCCTCRLCKGGSCDSVRCIYDKVSLQSANTLCLLLCVYFCLSHVIVWWCGEMRTYCPFIEPMQCTWSEERKREGNVKSSDCLTVCFDCLPASLPDLSVRLILWCDKWCTAFCGPQWPVLAHIYCTYWQQACTGHSLSLGAISSSSSSIPVSICAQWASL